MEYLIAVEGCCWHKECPLWQEIGHECILTALDRKHPNYDTGCFDYEYIDDEDVVGEPKVIIFK